MVKFRATHAQWLAVLHEQQRTRAAAAGAGPLVERLDDDQVRRLALRLDLVPAGRPRQVGSRPVCAPGALGCLVAIGGEPQRAPVARGRQVGDLARDEPGVGRPAAQVLQCGGELVRADRCQLLQALGAATPPDVDHAGRQPADPHEHVDGRDRRALGQQGVGGGDAALEPGPRPTVGDGLVRHDLEDNESGRGLCLRRRSAAAQHFVTVRETDVPRLCLDGQRGNPTRRTGLAFYAISSVMAGWDQEWMTYT